MTKTTPKATLLGGVLLLVFGTFFGQAMAMDSTDAPENVTLDFLQELYTAVDFDHQMHTELYGCNTCHHHTTGDGPKNAKCAKCHATSEASDDVSCSGCHQASQATAAPLAENMANAVYHIDKPGIKGALHLQCLGCHQIADGPTGCLDCHVFTPKGTKTFFRKHQCR